MQRTCTGSRFEIRFTLWLPEAMPIANVLIQSFEDFPPKKKSRRLRRSGHLNRRIDGRAPISVFSGRKGLSQTSMRRRFVFC